MTEEVTTYHLSMSDRSALLTPEPRSNVRVVKQVPADPRINHAMFMEVGTPFRWFSRLDWTIEDWEHYTNDPSVETWLGLEEDRPFGYFELQHRSMPGGGEETEIMFFGILPSAFGRGLGGLLLAESVQAAWSVPGTDRVYVHTCTSDHPAALKNYLSRGFTVERTETALEFIPEDDDAIWSSPLYYQSIRARTQGQAPTVTSRR
jgi:GNAT superfamily N-acetyltransferase